MIGGWFGIIGGAGVIYTAWSGGWDTTPSWHLLAAAGVVLAVAVAAGAVMPRAVGPLSAFGEPLVFAAAVVEAVRGKWVDAVALALAAFALEMGRRVATHSMIARGATR